MLARDWGEERLLEAPKLQAGEFLMVRDFHPLRKGRILWEKKNIIIYPEEQAVK